LQQLKERIDTIRNEYLKRLGEFRGNEVLSCQVEKVLEERDKLLVNKINLERELFDCKKELKFIKHTKTECESHLKILRIKMQEQTERRSSRSPRKVQSGAAGGKQTNKIGIQFIKFIRIVKIILFLSFFHSTWKNRFKSCG